MKIWGIIALVVVVTWVLFMAGKLFYLEIQKNPSQIWAVVITLFVGIPGVYFWLRRDE